MDHTLGSPLLTNEDLRQIARWAADCAERALPVFEAKSPEDARPREAIAAARTFAASGTRTANLRKVAWAALKAAGEVGDPAAAAAARAASTAAASAYTHPIATPHQVNHILSPAAYSAYAIGLDAADEAAAETEVRWALEQALPTIREVVRRMPARVTGKSRMSALLHRLDKGLRG
jgi:hypothetical protein